MENGITTILATVSDVVTAAVGWMTDFLTEVTTQPVLTIFVVAVPLVGLGVGLLNRLIRTN